MRPEVIAFAQQMEKRLAEYDTKRGSDGWKGVDVSHLFARLEHKTEHLEDMVDEYQTALARKVPRQDVSDKRTEIARLAADAGNYLMMVVDCCMALPLAEPSAADVLVIRLQSVLRNARAQIATLGSPDDAVNQAHLQELDDALKRKPVALTNVVIAALQYMDPNERSTLFSMFCKDCRAYAGPGKEFCEDCLPSENEG